MNEIIITGAVQTNLSEEDWYRNFCEWLESRDEYFGGGVNLYDDNDTADTGTNFEVA